jgi:hypothetical protein
MCDADLFFALARAVSTQVRLSEHCWYNRSIIVAKDLTCFSVISSRTIYLVRLVPVFSESLTDFSASIEKPAAVKKS